jgi:hypothetical protein
VLESKAKSTAGLVKLVEIIHDVGSLLQPSTEPQHPLAFQEWLERMRKVAGQFEFELRTELTRLGGEMPEPRPEPAANLESGLKLTLERYQQVLSCALIAHTRAMLTRQSREIRRASEEFAALSRAA